MFSSRAVPDRGGPRYFGPQPDKTFGIPEVKSAPRTDAGLQGARMIGGHRAAYQPGETGVWAPIHGRGSATLRHLPIPIRASLGSGCRLS